MLILGIWGNLCVWKEIGHSVFERGRGRHCIQKPKRESLFFIVVVFFLFYLFFFSKAIM